MNRDEQITYVFRLFPRKRKRGREMTVIEVIIGVIFIGLFITLAIDIIGK